MSIIRTQINNDGTTTIWNGVKKTVTKVPTSASPKHVQRLKALRAFNRLSEYEKLRLRLQANEANKDTDQNI